MFHSKTIPQWGQDAHRELPYMVTTVIWVMESLSDLVDDSEDCSGKPAKSDLNFLNIVVFFQLKRMAVWNSD